MFIWYILRVVQTDDFFNRQGTTLFCFLASKTAYVFFYSHVLK